MNLGSKNKKRVVLPSRPEPPTVDQILEDINRAPPSDPVFNILEKTGHDGSDSDVDLRFRQCSQYLDLTERLQEARGRLQLQREGLQVAAERLQSDVAESRGMVAQLGQSDLAERPPAKQPSVGSS